MNSLKKISIRKNIVMLIALFLSNSLLGKAEHLTNQKSETTVQSDPVKNQLPVNLLDTITTDVKKQMQQLYSILSTLSGLISDHHKNKKINDQCTKNIMEVNTLLLSFEREKFINVNLETIEFLLQFNQALANHITKTLNNGCVHFPAFYVESLLKRAVTPKKTSPILVQNLLTRTKKQVSVLMDKVNQGAGLRWYNRGYRKLNKYIIAPSIKHSIPQRSLYSLSGISAGTLVWWRLFNPSFTTVFERIIGKEKVNALFGTVPEYDVHLGTIKDAHALRGVGKLEYYVTELNKGLLPITAFLGVVAIKGLRSEWGDEASGVKAWVTKKLTILHNKLMGGSYLKEADKVAEIVEDVTFDDLVGLEHVKLFFRLLINYLENPESYDRLGLTPPKGILLMGDTRTGKSYSVKALYGEIERMLKRNNRHQEFKFIPLSASLINQKGIGWALNIIKHEAPCIVFIDEIDLLDLQRKGKNETLSEFLTYLSGVMDSKDPKNQVIIIGATNMPETLDKALRQPGRFGKELIFTYPKFEERKLLIKKELEKLSLPLEMFDLDHIARITEGQSFEGLKLLIRNAVIKSRMFNQIVTQQHIEDTLDEELRNIISSENRQIAAHQKEILAAHFAGHALALLLFDTHTKLSKVTIKDVKTDIKEEMIGMHLWRDKNDDEDKQKRLEHGKVFTMHLEDSIDLYTRDEKMALCKFHLAGVAAEELLLGSCGYSCHTEDKNRAFTLAQSLAFEGLDPKQLPKQMQNELYDKAKSILNQCKQDITQLFSQNKEKLTRLAHVLQEKETLSAQQVKEIVEG